MAVGASLLAAAADIEARFIEKPACGNGTERPTWPTAPKRADSCFALARCDKSRRPRRERQVRFGAFERSVSEACLEAQAEFGGGPQQAATSSHSPVVSDSSPRNYWRQVIAQVRRCNCDEDAGRTAIALA